MSFLPYKQKVPEYLMNREPIEIPFTDEDGWRDDREVLPSQFFFGSSRNTHGHDSGLRVAEACGVRGNFRTVRMVPLKEPV